MVSWEGAQGFVQLDLENLDAQSPHDISWHPAPLL